MKRSTRRCGESGQALMLGVAIGLVLVIAIALIVFVNQTAVFHQTARSKTLKGESVAQQGVAYAIQALSASTNTWTNALNGTFPSTCNGAAVTTVSGSDFKIYCSTGLSAGVTLQPFQVGVIAVALAPAHGNAPSQPLRAIQAVLSRRTLGADTANNIHIPAALQMVRTPLITSQGALTVHWGPIVCFESALDITNSPTTWVLQDPLDSSRFPRKFSAAGITGSAFLRSGTAGNLGPDSDQKEYWAHSSLALPPTIDEVTYIRLAKNETGIPNPSSKQTMGTMLPSNCATGSSCGYFSPGGDTVVFGGPYTPPSGSVIYVDGSAQFDQMSVDNATIIVTGALTITTSGGGSAITLNVPATAPLEYPYAATDQPCQNMSSCTQGNISFRGFLYVKGNIYVNTVGWTMAGALLSGNMHAITGTSGRLVIPGDITAPANASLLLYYDSNVTENILVNPVLATGQIKIAPDLVKDIPAF